MDDTSKHVAIIMDGNRRWAKQRGLSAIEGHQHGAEALKEIIRVCPDLGISYLTVYAFSSENWERSQCEVRGLMDLLIYYLKTEIQNLHQARVRLRVLGDRRALPADICQLIGDAEQMTHKNDQLFLQIAIGYGGRDEIVRAMSAIGAQIKAGIMKPSDITESLISKNLDTAGIPDPTVLIRTSGEQRLSNYMLWQLAYTEFFFINKLWPDFLPKDLEKIQQEYRTRRRRFGGTSSEIFC